MTNAFEDKVLECSECGNEFVFTAGEQEFYQEKGFQNEPRRCSDCRRRRRQGGASQGGYQSRQMYKAVCADCGQDCEVPFEPRTGRPVYCRECYPRHRRQ